MTKLRIALIGWGAINQRVAALIAERSPAAEIVAVAVSDRPGARHDVPRGAGLIRFLGDLDRAQPDLVVEAAGRDAAAAWVPRALACARGVILASASALVEDELLATFVRIAEEHESQLVVPAGAVGGIDALKAAGLGGLERVHHAVVKPPRAWFGTEAESLVDLRALTGRETFFEGTAREAARRFPQNANATVVTALAGLGLDGTEVALVADPSAETNGHEITAEGAFGRMRITLENKPLAGNPKSSELTALSILRLIENAASPFVV
ncbi:MAG: aspartate dehydrogenase [Methylobacteriaceae bacterium]|nr:aspartate dehydrogenase [Methylobacteriaceae bacterium]